MNARLLCAIAIAAFGCVTSQPAEGYDVGDCYNTGNREFICGDIGFWGSYSAGTADMYDSWEYNLVQAAFGTWANQFEEGGEASRIAYLGTTSSYPPFPPNPSGGINYVFWCADSVAWEAWADSPISISESAIAVDGICITGCDIVFRDHGIDWGDGDILDDTHDVQSAMAHELGHCLGLQDLVDNPDPCNTQVMWWELPSGVRRRSVGLGDEWGFYYLYGGPLLISYFTATAESAQVRLEWYSTDGTDTGTIYRGGSCWGPFEWFAPFSSNTGENYLIDDTVEYSREYYYLMITDEEQRFNAHASPLGLPSWDAPDPPSSLVALDVLGDCGGVSSLSWSSSPDPDAIGYHVYRTSPYIPVSCNSDARNYYMGSTFAAQFIDSTAALGLTYEYFVAAYDSTGAVSDTTNHAVCGSERDLPVVVSPDSCSVEIAIADSLGICPLGDMGKLEISVTVRDQCGWAVWSLPAEEIFAVIVNSLEGPVSCLNDTIYASSPTNGNGLTAIEIQRIGGCGNMTFDVYADGVLIGQPTIWLTGPDLNADCAVDVCDYDLFEDLFNTSDPCADLNGDSQFTLLDQLSFNDHYQTGSPHFSAHPGYSEGMIHPSDPSCLVLCPAGDATSFVDSVKVRNARDNRFCFSDIPADSVWASIPQPGGGGMNAPFRFLCRPSATKATADQPVNMFTGDTEITVNSGGGHSQDLPITTYAGTAAVDGWTGDIVSPDIDANGRVDYTDVMIFSIDDQGAYNFRSDMNCDDDINNTDFLFINAHYGHRCGASSQALAGGDAGSRPWSNEVVTATRAVVPNSVLDQWLSFDLHAELRRFLEEVRSLVEPEDLARGGGKTDAASASLLPRVTAIAQSAPNPFRVTALINYQVAPPGGRVCILIFDAAGRRVRTLVDKKMPPGFYAIPWDGRNDSGLQMASGVYFYQMKAPGFSSNKRMILVR